MQRAWNPHCNVQLNWKLLQLVSILGFSQSLEIVECDFNNILQTHKFAMKERTKCQMSRINEEQVNKRGLISDQSSKSKLKYCMYRAAYTVTVTKKSGWYDDATFLNEKSQINPTFYAIKESVCQNLWQGHKTRLLGLGDFEFNAPKEVLNEMNDWRTDAEFAQKVTKAFMKGGDEKGVNYVYPVHWINPKAETQKGKFMINAEIFMGTLFIETREANEGTWLCFKDPLKQKETLLYQGDTFEIDSVHYLIDHNKKQNTLTIVIFPDPITAKKSPRWKQKILDEQIRQKKKFSFSVEKQDKTDRRFSAFRNKPLKFVLKK